MLPDTRLRAFVLAHLQEEGYQVVAVPEFGAARGLLARGQRPRVVVAELAAASDPELQGLARSGVAVLAVSGQLERDRAARLGLPYVVRPFTVGQLVERVRSLAGRPEAPPRP